MNMKKLIACILILLSCAVYGQSSPGFFYGQVPTPGQWNSYFSAKQDYVSGGSAGNIFTWNGSAWAPSTAIAGSSLLISGNSVLAHVYIDQGSAAPSIVSGACGTTNNGSVSGSDQSGEIIISTATTTSCAVSFGSTWAYAPMSCVFSPANSTAAAIITTIPYISAISTTGFTLSGSVLASTNWYYHCF